MNTRTIRLDWPNARQVQDGVFAAGQPAPEQIRAAARLGIRTIVNLCAKGECGWDEAATVREAGLRYLHIPVCGPEDICESKARELHELLGEAGLRPMVVHCGSANRVGALFALQAFHCEGRDMESALELGRKAGLAGAEPRVRQCMQAVS